MDIIIADEIIKYSLIKSSRKTVSIEVTRTGDVIVRGPYGLTEREAKRLLSTRQRWIYTKVKAARESSNMKPGFETGRILLYLGKEVELKVDYVNSGYGVCLEQDELHVRIPNGKETSIPKMLEAWYRQQAKRILVEMTEYYADIMQVTVNSISIKDQKTRWGSCSSKHNINYNYRLVMAPKPVMEYVVIHELCHLLHMNHSKEFWKEVEKLQIGYIYNRKWLKEHQDKLQL